MKSGIINISFGEKSHNPKSIFDIILNVSKEKASETEKILRDVGFEPDYSIFFKIPNNNESDLEALAQAIDEWTTQEPVKNDKESKLQNEIYNKISEKAFSINVKREHSAMWVQIRLDDSLGQMIEQTIESFKENLNFDSVISGHNSFEISISSNNSFFEIVDDLKSNEFTLATNLLKNLSFKIEVKFVNEFLPKVKEILAQVGIPTEEVYGLNVLEHLDEFEITLENQSTENLPESFKKVLFESPVLEKISSTLTKDNVLKKLFDCIGGEFEQYCYFKDILSLNIKGKGEGFLKFLEAIKEKQ